ncbi:MAG: hypothetical protein JWP80_3159 [Pseudomonas sp.]|nr:hypothetical protein [Pseudomonas sp.]
MSAPAAVTALKPAQIATNSPGLLLQRKCACGKSTGSVSGQCDSCQRDKLIGVQTKLRVGASDDPLEQEADGAASRVLSMAAAQFAPQGGHDFRQLSVHNQAPAAGAYRADSQPAEPPAHDLELTHGGAPLAPGLRSFFESRYGRDLSEVRVHTGKRAESWNDSLNAHAFTYGSHVWLGRGNRPSANFLMAHELAHVIQQRQPRMLQRLDRTREHASPSLSGAGPVVRRLELGLPFWVPLGAAGKMGGAEIHEELLAIAQANNKKLDIEAPAPDATAGAWGLGLQGSIDLYQGKNARGYHAQVGLYFDGVTGIQDAPIKNASPEKHRRANKAGIASGAFNPFASSSGVIEGIKKGPTDVAIGELKPAALPILDKGAEQIEHYKKGMQDASRLTNAWAAGHGSTEKWSLNPPTSLPDAAVKFKQGGQDMKFNPASPRSDRALVLATISETSTGGKYKVKVRFNPAKYGLEPIMGGLYAQLFQPGKGLWTYFARPADLSGALGLARRALVRGEMTLANQVQEQVINPLTAAPKKVTPLLRDRSAPLVIRRAPKAAPVLKDEFKFDDWKTNQANLRSQISGPTATAGTQKTMASLELLERAYEAEEALDKVPGTGKSKLPPKSADTVKINGGKGSKPTSRNLADMASWLTGWTGRPAEILGFFRDKFGTAFVWVANKLSALRDLIHAKLKKVFEGHPSKPGGSKGKIIAKALLKALLQVAKVLLPRAVHLFMDAVAAGIKKKLVSVFEIDPVKLGEDVFGADFKQWNSELDGFRDDADTYVTKVVDEYSRDLGWIKDVMDVGSTIGTLLEAASVAIQCGKKPGWNCLLLLSQTYRECGMEKALNICLLQKQISSLVADIGPLADLPVTLAQKTLDVVKDAAPVGLKDVFSEPVATSGGFNNDDIDCEDTPSELNCPSIPIPLFDSNQPSPWGDKPNPQDKKDGKEDNNPPQKKDETPPPPPPPRPEPKSPPVPDTPDTPDNAGPKPSPSDPEGNGHGEPGAPKRQTDNEGRPVPGPGNGPGSGAGAAGGTGQAPQELPVPEEVHKALNDLLNQQGPQALEALAKLAQAAGMPDDAPLTAEQVKKLQELLNKGALKPKDLQQLADQKAGPGLKGRARPLDVFLGKQAHQAVLDQTLEKLRTKQYDFKFQEMAALKVHWRVMLPYAPGPFRNAPALMWTDSIRAAGVVDGSYGKCYDGGKIPMTITRADMHEVDVQKGTEHPVTVHTPFHDNNAQLTGGVCPTPPKGRSQTKRQDPPKPKGGGQSHEGDQQQGAGNGEGQQPAPGSSGSPQQGPGQPPAGGAAPGGDVDSKVNPGGDSDSPQGAQQNGESAPKDQDKDPAPPKDPEEQGPKDQDKEQPLNVDVTALAGGCGFPPSCTVEPWKVDFEELGALADGYLVMPDKAKDPTGGLSMLNPPNTLSPFSIHPVADGSLELVMTCEGKTCVVGKVQPSSVSPATFELISGPLFDSLRALLSRFLKEKRTGSTTRVDRIHFL